MLTNSQRYSFLRGLSESGKDCTPVILTNSIFLKPLLIMYNHLKYSIINYSKESKVLKSIRELREDFNSFPVKKLSIILIAAILTNSLLLITLNKPIGVVSWVIRGLFLLTGVAGLLSNATWEDLKKDSRILPFLINLINWISSKSQLAITKLIPLMVNIKSVIKKAIFAMRMRYVKRFK